MSDDAAIQAQIAALAGQINLKKQQALQSTAYPPKNNHSYQQTRYHPYHQPRHPTTFRNRTLITNGSDHASSQKQAAVSESPSFVRSRGINNQLMTKSTYEREQIAKSVQQQTALGQRTQRWQEQQAVVKHAQQASVDRVLEIEGIRFQMRQDGSKLTRIPNQNSTQPAPKRAVIAGVEFLRTKNGNLLRKGALKDNIRTKFVAPQCEHFTKNGKCSYGPRCKYTHDPKKVAICKTFLRTGQCPNQQTCDLSHEPTYHRVSACTHYLQGRCNNDNCRWPHVDVDPSAPVCSPFAKLGYCDAGRACGKRHVHECPDYANTGVCPMLDRCPLPHILRASATRMIIEESEEESENDSDQGERDLDSDDLDEDDVLMESENSSISLANNDDYVPLK